MTERSTFVLVHGAGHGGWCWRGVAAALEGDGDAVVAPDLPCEDPCSTLVDDVAAVEAAVEVALGVPIDDAPRRSVVIVGHSLGALAASVLAARGGRAVRRLAFVAGIIGAPGRSLADLVDVDADRDLPLAPEDFEQDDRGRFRFTDHGARRALFHDCDEGVTADAVGRLRWQRSRYEDVAGFDEWPDVELLSIVCEDDRIASPAWGARVSLERLGVDAVRLPGGHSPFLTRPAELARLLAGPLRP